MESLEIREPIFIEIYIKKSSSCVGGHGWS